ncbi:MAG: hypothetical protein IH913_07750 [Proteobacteria bacterium]|nr:hypothetical protein [Pseudomonadota bacterium]
MSILKAFLKFTDEAALIGRMLAGYADLEIGLMNCVQVVRNDFDTVLKSMFRTRGETQRIDVADAFGRQYYDRLGIGTQFGMAIGAVRYCLKIRNQYAHCQWWDDNSGRLAFANLEKVAKVNTLVKDLQNLTTNYVDMALLEEQLAYYEYAERLLTWVNLEGQRLADQSCMQKHACPEHVKLPPLL